MVGRFPTPALPGSGTKGRGRVPLSVETPPAILVKLDYWCFPVNSFILNQTPAQVSEYFFQKTITSHELCDISGEKRVVDS
jgi:hypothetical protein